MIKSLALILLFFGFISQNSDSFVIDFGKSTGGSTWNVTNDGVMGGVSKGYAFLSDSSVIFKGDVSLENNGGFASLRSPYSDIGFARFSTVEIKYRSSGLPFSITFSKSRRYWIPNYKYILPENGDEWKTETFKLAELKEYRLGNFTGNNINQNTLKNLIGISFFNEGKQEGKFTLEIDYLKFE
jgi:hypothetical protein